MVVSSVVLRYCGWNNSQRARRLLLLPHRRFGQERADEDQGDGGDDAGDQRVTPRLVPAHNRGQGFGVRDHQGVSRADHEPAGGGEGLGVAEGLLALVGVGEQLGQPGDGGDELDADADERGISPI